MTSPGQRMRNASASDDRLTNALERTSLHIVAAYLLGTTLPLLFSTLIDASWTLRLSHAIALVAVVWLAERKRRPTPARAWTPLILIPALYIELRWIIAAVGRPHADRIIAAWDVDLFGSSPSHELAMRWQSQPLSELLHLCYLAYYAIVFLPPAVLWLQGRRREFALTVQALAIAYTICFVVFVVMPVDGPRFLSGPSIAPDGPIRTLVVRILSAGSSKGTAFPSAHVSASIVAGICALRYYRLLGIAIMVVTFGMMVGAVYGGYHYAIDVIAGLAAGLVAATIAKSVERIITARSTAPQ
ncbi:MAG: phosphatase PAP2 family protein [bacterium]